MAFASRASFYQTAGASFVAAILAACGGGDADTQLPADATGAAKTAGVAPAAGSGRSLDCASKVESLTAEYGAELGISCTNGVLQLREKAAEPVEVLSTGPWIGAASEAPSAKDAALPHVDFGGGGGVASTVLCPTVIGATGRSGSFIDAISVTCIVGSTEVSVGPFGGGGGGPYALACPSGFVGIGIQGRAGSFVDRLGFVCGDSAGNRFTTGQVGGNGGGQFYFQCPSNQKLVGFNIRSGSFVDNLQPLCGNR